MNNDKEIKKLQHSYDVWYRDANRGKTVSSSHNYDQNLKIVATFDTVQKFWAVYTHLVRPNELTRHSDLHIFKSGIKPLWEDEANKNGGMWKLRVRKGLASRLWENLLLAYIGEQFKIDDEICGVVISCRYQDYLSVWNRNGQDSESIQKIKQTLKRVLDLPKNTLLEYKQHSDALRKIRNQNRVDKE
ncbi:hypothetical protein NH340_JMT06190 [Sarcoptes scabiei]|nr:hypothetical protein NH340_JMT06190 [Sarcoptes scabiei]